MKRQQLLFWSVCVSLAMFFDNCFAKTNGFGVIAEKIAEPLQGVTKIVHIVAIVAGAGLLVGAVIKYLQHRRNPIEVTLGSCLVLLIAGLALIALTFAPYLRVSK